MLLRIPGHDTLFPLQMFLFMMLQYWWFSSWFPKINTSIGLQISPCTYLRHLFTCLMYYFTSWLVFSFLQAWKFVCYHKLIIFVQFILYFFTQNIMNSSFKMIKNITYFMFRLSFSIIEQMFYTSSLYSSFWFDILLIIQIWHLILIICLFSTLPDHLGYS